MQLFINFKMQKLAKIIVLLLLNTFIFTSCNSVKKVNSTNKLDGNYPIVTIFEQQEANKLGPCEPSIFINPKNPNNIVAGSVIDFVHYSMDSGKTWKTKFLNSDLGVYGDPCVIADKDGNFYYFHLSNPDNKAYNSKRFLDRMVVQKSINGGENWSNGTGIGKNKYPKQQDKEWAAINPINNEIYLTWTEFDKYGSNNKKHRSRILFSKSTNGAETWSKPKILSELEGDAIDGNKTVEGAVPAVATNGNIYVSWSFNNKIYFDKSTNGGNSWLKNDIEVCNQPNGWSFDVPGFSRVNGMPITCVDTSKSSKYKNTIYINFSDQRNGANNTDIFIVKSTDEGKTWSIPLKVNTDKTKTHQFLTWMSIDPITGYIYIVFYDRSKYNNNKTDVVLAISKDGGETFLNKTISQRPFTPNPNVFFGDYNNINAYNGIIRPIWTAYYDNKLSVLTSLIKD